MDWKRWAGNLFIVCFSGLVVIDTLPEWSGMQTVLRRAVRPILNVTGLWQGTWDLFSPNVDAENHHIEVEFILSDGSTASWRSIDWTRASCLEKFRRVREVEYYDRIRNGSNRSAWSSFAHYAAANLVPDNARRMTVQEVRLAVVQRDIPPPGKSPPNSSRVVFYRETLSP